MANNSNRKAIEFMVQGALPPHSTNVLWMDTSVPALPVLKIFENGAWTNVHTEDGKVIELLAETVLAQQREIRELTEGLGKSLDNVTENLDTLQQNVAQEATLMQGVQDIREDISHIDIDTSDLAKQGTNPNATLSTTQAALIDGNDTTISVLKEICSEVGTSSDTAAETGTLAAVLKWTKNKIKDIYNALTDSTNGLSAIKTSAASAASDAASAKTAAQGITGYALQGSDPTATNTALAALIGYTITEIDGV